MSIYKECDIRGVYGEDLTLAVAERIGRAVGTILAGGVVVVGGDVRVSTPALKASLLAGLLRTPVRVIDVGRVPTPAFYDAIAVRGADGGVMVTASHNPAAYNGFKLSLGPRPVTPDDIARIAGLAADDAGATGQGSMVRSDTLAGYGARVRDRLAASTPMRIVLDAGNGAAALVAPEVLRSLGHDVVELFTDVDGTFPNRSPNPSMPGELSALQTEVLRCGADFGVAFDGDGDRAVFVDSDGRVASAEEALVVFARALVRHGDAVVYDLKSSSVVSHAVDALGGRPIMERSGHAFIRDTFLREGAVLAGEVSGHFFFRELGYDDGIYAAGKLAEVLADKGSTLAAEVADIPRPVITPDLRVEWPLDERDALLARVGSAFKDHPIATLDGVRVAFDDGWLLARKSVTEPAVTFRIEAGDAERLQARRDALLAAVPELAGRHPYFG
ncbi:MAG: phosphomannomutase/phosphoglucomutase [Trueperaceae bacterium]|nr:MAG: phosphomannomutase/phosphoglucomutase [Trueperaceae bacterium]